MLEEGLSYDEALSKAQALGFAESDPKNDVDGIDAAYKMVILSQFVYGMDVSMDDLTIEGIRQVTPNDVSFAQKAGYEIKLIGRSKYVNGAIEVSVGPCFVANAHPLASIKNEFNGVYIESTGIHRSMFYGPGAGALPTATSVVSDLVAIANNCQKNLPAPLFNNYHRKTQLLDDAHSIDCYYMDIQTTYLEKIKEKLSGYTICNQHATTDAYQVILEKISKDQLKELVNQLTEDAKMIRVMKVIENN